jgi:hypothetical protein
VSDRGDRESSDPRACELHPIPPLREGTPWDAGDYLSDLDGFRADQAAAALRAVSNPPASTTAATLARRFGPDELAGIQAAWLETAGDCRAGR